MSEQWEVTVDYENNNYIAKKINGRTVTLNKANIYQYDSDQNPEVESVKDPVWINTFLNDTKYAIIKTDDNGNCFFDTIHKAIPYYSIEYLREIVSKNITQDMYNQKKLLYNGIIDNNGEKEGDAWNNVKYMENINTLQELKNYVNTKDFWADEFAISTLEDVLKIKMIILSKESYNENASANILNCGEKNINMGADFNPEKYIITSFTGNHYELVTYYNKTAFSFDEIPIGIKKLIVEKCLTGDGVYNSIPEFKSLSKSNGDKSNGGKSNDDKSNGGKSNGGKSKKNKSKGGKSKSKRGLKKSRKQRK